MSNEITITPQTSVLMPFGEGNAAPMRFRATTVRNGFEVALDVAIEPPTGTPRCRAFAMRPASEDGEVTGEALRMPVATLLREALAAAAFRIEPPTRDSGERPRREFPWADYFAGLPVPAERFEEDLPHPVPLGTEGRSAFYERLAEGARGPRRGSPITDEHLGSVATIYRAAVEQGDPPTQAVADAMHAARSTAARWVMLARKRNFLGKATKGRAGEQKEEE